MYNNTVAWKKHGVGIKNQIKHKGEKNMENFVIVNEELQEYIGEDENVVIPEGITSIASKAFYRKNMKSVTFPKSLTRIEKKCFLWM